MTNPSIFSLLILMIITSTGIAQTVSVKKESMRIKNETADGYSVVLEGKEVNNAFVKYLKTYGKVKQGFDYHTMTEASLNGKKYISNIYASANENENKSEAWIGIKANEWSGDEAESITKELEKIVYDFGIQYYRDKIQLQIDESNRALQAVERQQQRFVNQNRDFNIKLEDNKREKIQLEKSIENNKLEYETLLKQIDQNKKDQDSLQIANEQIKKVIDMQKVKQGKVGVTN